MRITINVSNELAQSIKVASEQEAVSVSAFVSSCVEADLSERKRKKLGKDVCNISGKTPVSRDVFDALCASRVDHENRM